jgi:hypothetical protein
VLGGYDPSMPNRHIMQTLRLFSFAAVLAMAVGCPDACGTLPCDDCVDIGALTPAEHTARYFPITGGSPHDDTACNGCHAVATTFAEFSCTSCHDHAVEVMDERHIPVDGYVFDSGVACRTCHPSGEALRDPNFAHTFPVATDTVHGPVSCASCHRTPLRIDTVNCIDCHDHTALPIAHDELPMGAVHGAVPDYEWTSVRCLTCHPNAEPVGVGINHEVYFPIAANTAHADIGCVSCHTNPDDRTVIACKSCHEVETTPDLNTPHENVGEFIENAGAIDDAACVRCHADAQVNRIAIHSFPIHTASAFETKAAHAGQKCLDCHRESRTDKPWGADFTVQTCTACHTADGDVNAQPPAGMDLVHEDIPGYVWTNLACRTCHPSAEPNGKMEHEAIFPIADKTAHEGVTCNACHVDDTKRSVLGCRECHTKPDVMDVDVAIAHVDVGEFAAGQPFVDSNDCARCHADAQIDEIKTHLPFAIQSGIGANPAAPHYAQRCTDCHTADRADKAWATDFPARQDCIACHAEVDIDPVHVVVPLFNYTNTACITCHPDGNRASYIDHESTFPIDAFSKHDGITCAECHIDNANPTYTGCKECHEADDNLPLLHVDVGEFVGAAANTVTSADCKKCHGDSEINATVLHQPFEIGFFLDDTGALPAHYQQPCLECHTEVRIDKTFATDFTKRTCLGCHTQPDTNPIHTVIDGYAYEDIGCQTCHPDGRRAATDFDHDPYFPIAAGAAHFDVACGTCHANPTEPKSNACQTCHLAEFGATVLSADHVDVGDFSGGPDAGSAACKLCHGDAQIEAVAVHVPFEIQKGPRADGSPILHYKQSCTSCHTAKRVDKPFALDFASEQACTSCHTHREVVTTPIHAVVPGYAFNDASCRSCHPDGRTAVAAVDHAPYFPIAIGDVHETVTCAECHVDVADPAVLGCQACHTEQAGFATVHAAVGEFQTGQPPPPACVVCHADAQVHSVVEHSSADVVPTQYFPINDTEVAHHLQRCTDCHTAARADKPWARDFTTSDCIGCHLEPATDPQHNGITGYQFATNACLTCHPSGGPAGTVDHEPFFPIAAGAAHAAVACGDCHLSSTDRSVVGCRECHVSTYGATAIFDDHRHVGEFALGTLPSSTGCKACHAESQIEPTAVHGFPIVGSPQPSLAAHYQVDCLGCHLESRKDKTWAADFTQHTCLDCHAHEEADMASIHQGIPNYLYNNVSCRACHADSQPTGTMDHEALFPLDPPAPHDAVTCNACHIDEANRAVLGCRECHISETPSFATVHNQVGEFQPGEPVVGSSECVTCHAESQVDAVDVHAPFLIHDGLGTGAAAPHNKQNCLECHQATRSDKPWAADFNAAQRCTTCHAAVDTNPFHTNLPTYNYTDTACLTCHGTGDAAEYIQHEITFPIGIYTKHAGIACGACHTNAGDARFTACLECHQGTDDLPTVHEFVPDYAATPTMNSALCKRCHGDGQIDAVYLHLPFEIHPEIDPVTMLAPPHNGQKCLDCHTATRTDKTFAADFTVRTCTGCHVAATTNPIHSVVPSYAYNNASCQTCHPDGRRALLAFDHTPYFPIAASDSHVGIGCGECHTNSTNPKFTACQECHLATDGAAALSTFHIDVGEFGGGPNVGSAMCKRCHADSQIEPVVDHAPFGIQSNDGTGQPTKHHLVQCTSCHTNLRTDKPFGADFAAPQKCTSCHEHELPAMQAVHSVVPGFAYNDLACKSCHPDGVRATADVDHTPYFPITGGAAHAALGCADCHISTTNPKTLGCQSCHSGIAGFGTVHTAVGEYQAGEPTPPACITCHGDSQVHSVVEHSSDTLVPDWFFPINDPGHAHNRQRCTDCHVNNRVDKTFARDFTVEQCTTCHTQPDMNGVHSGFSGYAWNTSSCLQCHPSGGPSGAGIDHATFFPIDTGAKHAGVACGDCHLDASDRSVVACSQCHVSIFTNATVISDHAKVGGFGTTVPSSVKCKACHAESQVTRVNDHGTVPVGVYDYPFLIKSNTKHYRKDCAQCHTTTRADKPWAIEFNQFTCLICHTKNKMDDKHNGFNGYAWANPNCMNCHPDGTKD